MKPKTLLLLEAGIGIAAVTLALVLNSSNAAADDAKPAPEKPAAEVAAAVTGPAAPAGPAADAPPAVPALVPPPLELSAGMEEVVKLARSGVTEDVLIAFIEKSGKVYNPSAEEIIYLKDLGVAPAAIAKLIRTGDRDSELAKQVEAGKFEQVEAAAPGATAVSVAAQNHYAAAPQPIAGSPAAPEVAAEPETNVDINYFKTSLSPYGTWVYVEGVGECWRPTVGMVSSDWRPYYDGGRWIYTNSGWYWLSDYSWGWAPFHYGRWTQHGNWGWVWAPGYTWGPAWVEWRTTAAYCGWAPLPPYYGSGFGVSYWGGSWGFSIGWSSYCWVPYRYCNGYYPRHYAAHHGEGHGHYNNSTVVRPTINVNGNNNTVIVTGPDATVVANSGRTEIRRVDIRDVSGRGNSGPREYVENGGRTLAAYRPTVRPDRNRPEVALASQREEFRRPARITPTTASASGTTVTAAEAADPRNIIVRGNANSARSAGSASAGRAAVAPRSVDSTAVPRLAGQNTTINPRPEFQRPASEATPILRDGRTMTITRQTQLSEPVIGGATRSETTRTTRTFGNTPSPSLHSVSRQSVTAPERSFQSPSVSVAPASSPVRRPYTDTGSADSPASSYRSESSRPGRPVIAPSAAPARFESPAMRSPAMSAPVIAPSARPSYSAPAAAPAPSFSRPASPEPARSFSSPAPASAPTRSASPPSNSGGGGGGDGGSRSGGPRRQN